MNIIKKKIIDYLLHSRPYLVDDWIIDNKKIHSHWEENHLKKLFEHYKIDCVFDVGANYGQYAQMLRNKVGFEGYIFSYEPNPPAFEALIKLSKNDNKWIVYEKGLADIKGKSKFNIMKGSQFSSFSLPKHDESSVFIDRNVVEDEIEVEIDTVENEYKKNIRLFRFTSPFLKMDTQGFDTKVVDGAKSILTKFIGLQSELSIKKLYIDSIDYREALTYYEKQGFTLSALVPNNQGNFPVLIEVDCIMINSSI